MPVWCNDGVVWCVMPVWCNDGVVCIAGVAYVAESESRCGSVCVNAVWIGVCVQSTLGEREGRTRMFYSLSTTLSYLCVC